MWRHSGTAGSQVELGSRSCFLGILWCRRFKRNYLRESTDLRVNLVIHDQNRFKREFVLFGIFSRKSNL